jgi:hypothetical protein
MDGGSQIKIRGDKVGVLPSDDGEDELAITRMSRLVWRWRWRVSYVACKGRRSSRLDTTEASEPAEYRGASKSATVACVEEFAGAESTPLLE